MIRLVRSGVCRFPAARRAWLAVATLLALPALAASQPADASLIGEAPCTIGSTSYDEYIDFLSSRPPGEPRDTPFDAAVFRRNHPREWFDALKEGKGVRWPADAEASGRGRTASGRPYDRSQRSA